MIKNEQDRAKLSEGRSYGIGFGYLKKTGKDKYKTVTPLSPCKDYLNDVIYSETLNVPIGACGLKYEKQNIFDGKKGYLAMDFLESKYGSRPQFATDKQAFEQNIGAIQTVINWVEDKLNVPHSEITKDGDLYLVKGDNYWHTSTYLISLYTLLLRMAIKYTTGDVGDFLNNYPGNDPDAHIWASVKPKLMLLIAGHKIEQKFDKSTGQAIHSAGIVNYKDFKL